MSYQNWIFNAFEVWTSRLLYLVATSVLTNREEFWDADSCKLRIVSALMRLLKLRQVLKQLVQLLPFISCLLLSCRHLSHVVQLSVKILNSAKKYPGPLFFPLFSLVQGSNNLCRILNLLVGWMAVKILMLLSSKIKKVGVQRQEYQFGEFLCARIKEGMVGFLLQLQRCLLELRPRKTRQSTRRRRE